MKLDSHAHLNLKSMSPPPLRRLRAKEFTWQSFASTLTTFCLQTDNLLIAQTTQHGWVPLRRILLAVPVIYI